MDECYNAVTIVLLANGSLPVRIKALCEMVRTLVLEVGYRMMISISERPLQGKEGRYALSQAIVSIITQLGFSM